MDPKAVEELEERIEETIAEVIRRIGLRSHWHEEAAQLDPDPRHVGDLGRRADESSRGVAERVCVQSGDGGFVGRAGTAGGSGPGSTEPGAWAAHRCTRTAITPP